MQAYSEEQKKALSGLCRIEIKRWKAASESNPNMRYMVELMGIALAALTAEPVGKFVFEALEGRYHHIKHGEHQHTEPNLPLVRLYTAPPVPAPAVPNGWKLVPIEPSWEMLSADGCKEHHNGQPCSHHDNRRRIWSAMLAAAPEVE